MSFVHLRHRVQRAEQLLEGRERQAQEQWSALGQGWRGLWTPWRIVIAGVGLGFFTGRSEPVAAIGGLTAKLGGAPRLLDMIATVSGLVGAFHAQVDAGGEAAAETAAAVHADAPRPAEAATELSERD